LKDIWEEIIHEHYALLLTKWMYLTNEKEDLLTLPELLPCGRHSIHYLLESSLTSKEGVSAVNPILHMRRGVEVQTS